MPSKQEGSGRHQMSVVYSVVSYLKTVRVSKTLDDLRREAQIDVPANSDIFRLLASNDKIVYNASKGTFTFKPPFRIRDKEDLHRLLSNRRHEGGMHVKELKESDPDVVSAAEQLIEEGKILALRNKDSVPTMLFYNDINLNLHIDPEFRELWRATKIPDEVDLKRELINAGLKSMETFEKRTIKPKEAKPKRAKPRQRRIKITNTHLPGLDLTQDFAGPSA